MKFPLDPCEIICFCSETKLEHLCILKYTWKKWMYFFLQRTACFTQCWRSGNICVALCASVLKCTDIFNIYMRKMTDCQSGSLWVFQERRGRPLLPALCQRACCIYMHFESGQALLQVCGRRKQDWLSLPTQLKAEENTTIKFSKRKRI